MDADSAQPDPNNPPATRVAIVDDHAVLVDAMKIILQSKGDTTVVGMGYSCAECLEIVTETRPQVLILDIALPDGSGVDLVPTIKEISPDTNVLILTSYSDEGTIRKAMQAGACGFLPKSRNLSDLLTAVRKAATGEIVMPAGLLAGVLSQTAYSREATGLQVTLSQRELEILRLLSQGQNAEQIAAALTISIATTRTHIRNLMQKMDVRSQLQAVAVATRRGWIEPLV